MGKKPSYEAIAQRVEELEKRCLKQKALGRALRESEELLKATVEATADGILVVDENGKILHSNKRFAQLWNIPDELMETRDDRKLLDYVLNQLSSPNEFLTKVQKLYKSTDEDFDTIHFKNGQILERKSRPLMRNKEIYGRVWSFRDVTEQKQAMNALQKGEERHRIYFENVSDVIFSIDPDFRIINISPSVERVLGYTPKEMIGKPIQDLNVLDPDSLQKAFSDIMKVLSGKRIPFSQYEFISKDGARKFGEVSLSPLTRNGKVVAMVSVARDITERKSIEDALKQSKERYRIVLEANPDPVVVYDMEGKVIYFNKAFSNVFGWHLEECIGQKMDDFVPTDAWPETTTMINKVTSGENFSGIETRRYTKEGKIIPVSISGAIYRDESGNPIGSVINLRDISDQKVLEIQLQQAQKMEAIGTLAGGIAHDFNNLLMGIQGCTSLMFMDIDANHPNFEYLHRIENYIKNATSLTKQLLGFARKGKYEIKATDVNDLVNKSSEMFGRTKKEITIHIKCQSDIWPVEVDQFQIEQVLLNLYVNAWQAMSGTGELYIQTENIILNDKDVKAYGMPSGRYVKISVTDTGIGIDETIQHKIFDPFFTTKEISRGTGLGLASAYGIIKNHGGIINTDSKKGEGATFNIFLPASEKKIIKEKMTHKEILKGSETVLLVDDEDIIIDVGRDLLEKLGYEVLTAKSGREAVDIYKSNREKIDIVILDMVMPKMGGADTYEKLRGADPAVKVLLSSGYSIDGQASKILSRGCDGFIQKPFDIKSLSLEIRKILDDTIEDSGRCLN
ncbi:MAG: PAS domain S-box protein [Desulfobacterales bacterium]|jgi:PAS domain S-box-containing protein|nr:PAS domain S-box protein [Desulfobacterales bacterium]